MATTNDKLPIRALNDALRIHLRGGTWVLTSGVISLSPELRDAAIACTRAFDDFSPDNDPHHEHDFGAFEIDGTRFNWKIYYDRALSHGSPDPSDPSVTRRVLTLMLASEY